jgi:tetratricopeptide (TPR) repeat protein
MKFWLCIAFLLPYVLSAQSESAADLYGAGVRAYHAEDYTTALKKYSEALAIKPNIIGYLYSRGLAYQKLHSDSLADIDFHRVVSLDPKYMEAWYALGTIQMDEKHYDSAWAFFSNVLRLSQNDINTLHQKGLILYYKRKYFDAENIFTRIIQLDSADGDAYYKRGLVRMNDDNFDGAGQDFSESYRLDPDNTLALEQRALSFLRNNDLDNACKDWNVLLKKGNSRASGNIAKYCGK